MNRWLCVLVAMPPMLGALAHAHHSIAGVYDGSRLERIEGVVVEFRFVRPHPYLLLDALTSDGKTWRLEMDNHFELSRIGVTAETFEPGDRVVVTGNPSRTGGDALYLRSLDRAADGLRLEQADRRPRLEGHR
jgi:hypothetical protein